MLMSGHVRQTLHASELGSFLVRSDSDSNWLTSLHHEEELKKGIVHYIKKLGLNKFD